LTDNYFALDGVCGLCLATQIHAIEHQKYYVTKLENSMLAIDVV